MEGRDIRYERSGLSVRIEGKKIETGVTSKKSIKIAWPRNSQHATMLQLDPITERYGGEADVLAYTGRYGVAKKVKDEWEFADRDSAMSLEEAFCVPDGKRLLVKPTVDRWTIGKDELSAAYGDDVYTLHMGLGFLLLGEPWMYIGMHEAGHMPNNPDENLAWTTANTNFAQLARHEKDKIVAGETASRFEILRRPFWAKDMTIGKIMRYGLVSHSLAGNAKIPQPWQDSSRSIMESFRETITDAAEIFDKVFGKPSRF